MDHVLGRIGFLPTGRHDAHLIIGAEKKTPLYHLAYYSKHVRGMAFWREAKKDLQGKLIT